MVARDVNCLRVQIGYAKQLDQPYVRPFHQLYHLTIIFAASHTRSALEDSLRRFKVDYGP
jgi:hypothetical protein